MSPAPGTRRSLLTDPLPWAAMAVAFGLDQVSKALVIGYLPFRDSWPDEGFFRFTHTWNTGTAFGLFPQYGGLLTFVSLGAVVLLFVFYRSASSRPLLLRLAFGMQLGGAFGNLFDRVRIDHVTDFIDVGPWPVFNLADSAIVIGIALMAWHFWTATSKTQPASALGTPVPGAPPQSGGPATPAS